MNPLPPKLTLEAKRSKRRTKAGMMRSLTTLIGVIGVVIIPMAALLIYRQHGNLGMSLTDSIVSTAAAILGMIPDGLYLLVSVALAVSVIRLSKKRTLVRELKSIETLARTDVICVDKTGTITENKMEVTGVRPIPGNEEFSPEKATMHLTDFASAMAPDNNTMEAIKECFSGSSRNAAKAVIPFSSKNKYSGAVFENGEGYLLGAPEFILNDRYENYAQFFGKLSAKGSRVLLFARCDKVTGNSILPKYIRCMQFFLQTKSENALRKHSNISQLRE